MKIYTFQEILYTVPHFESLKGNQAIARFFGSQNRSKNNCCNFAIENEYQ